MLRMLRRWPALASASFVAAAIASLSEACNGDGAAPSTAPDSGSTTGAVGDGICPALAPSPGDPCLLPEGTTCAFGSCGTAIAQCLYGTWLYGGNVGPTPVCDPAPPTEGTACPPCWPPAVVCRYGSLDCSAADASANTTLATCPSGSWRLLYSPCADAGDAGHDGSADAGTDVQRDAEPDAD
jgi:hypothetical protein